MRAVVQRVSEARCEVDSRVTGQISRGLLVFLGVGKKDHEEAADYLIEKLIGLRVFPDSSGRMNYSLKQIEGGLLIIPQFTLYGDVRRGLRPSFDRAAKPQRARRLYRYFLEALRAVHSPVETGEFGAMMEIPAQNDGPVTVLLDSDGVF